MENTKKLKFSNLLIAILQGVILLLLFVIPELIVGVIGGVVAQFIGFDGNFQDFYVKNGAAFLLCGQILRIIIFLLIIKFRTKIFQTKYNRDYLKKRKITFSEIVKLFVVGIGLIGLINITVALMMYLGKFFPQIVASLEVYNKASEELMKGNMMLSVLAITIFAPISEELMLRGTLFTENERLLPYKWAIILNGIVFGVFHFNLFQGAYALIGGIVICAVYYYTESIYASILLHMINNTFSMVISSNEAVVQSFASIFGIVMLVCMVLMFVFLKDFKKKRELRHLNYEDLKE
ncbi:MAG: CPBP family intramembrane glutamic endopeptidase [Finegoldia magna]|nr:CPBP family intramembrane glutamic endopeptidase [Finegoldia magna]